MQSHEKKENPASIDIVNELDRQLYDIKNEAERRKAAHKILEESINKFHEFYKKPLAQILADFIKGEPNALSVYETRRRFPNVNPQDKKYWLALEKHLKAMNPDEMNDCAKILLARMDLDELIKREATKPEDFFHVIEVLKKVEESKDKQTVGIAQLYLAEIYLQLKDKNTQKKYLTLSADKDNAAALRLLGMQAKDERFHGKSWESKLAVIKSYDLLLKAIQLGDAEAVSEIAHAQMLLSTYGYSTFFPAALISLQRGCAETFRHLGDYLLKPHLIKNWLEQNVDEAVKCWDYAIQYREESFLYYHLGRIYMGDDFKQIRQSQFTKKLEDITKKTLPGSVEEEKKAIEELKHQEKIIESEDAEKSIFCLRKAIELDERNAEWLVEEITQDRIRLEKPANIYHIYMIKDILPLPEPYQKQIYEKLIALREQDPEVFLKLAKADIESGNKLAQELVGALPMMPTPLIKETISYLMPANQKLLGLMFQAQAKESDELPKIDLPLTKQMTESKKNIP